MPGFQPDPSRHSRTAGGKSEPEPSHAAARPKPSGSILQELDNLYIALRGAPYINSLGEAKKAFQGQDYREALRFVRATEELYRRSHSQILGQDLHAAGLNRDDVEKLSAKQEKAKGVLDRFEELVRRLEKLAKLEPIEPKAPVAPRPQPAARPLPRLKLSADFRAKFQAARDGDAQIQSVCEYFDAQAVETEEDFQLGALYSLQNQGQIHLIRCTKMEGAPATITMEKALSGKSLKPIPLAKLMELGREQLLHRLLPKDRAETGPKMPGEQVPQDPPANGAEDRGESGIGGDAILIDMGSFTQLQTAVQQTDLEVNADAVGFVREHEFREKKYQEAFDRIEGIFQHMRAGAEQRLLRLRQEDFDFRSGVLKMSPKDWMLKQARDIAMTQKIDRALRYFARVLDGLRILMTAAAKAQPKAPPDGT
jgi:hypothetical protein